MSRVLRLGLASRGADRRALFTVSSSRLLPRPVQSSIRAPLELSLRPTATCGPPCVPRDPLRERHPTETDLAFAHAGPSADHFPRSGERGVAGEDRVGHHHRLARLDRADHAGGGELGTLGWGRQGPLVRQTSAFVLHCLCSTIEADTDGSAVIVFENGKSGFNGEHSCMDVSVIHLLNRCYKLTPSCHHLGNTYFAPQRLAPSLARSQEDPPWRLGPPSLAAPPGHPDHIRPSPGRHRRDQHRRRDARRGDGQARARGAAVRRLRQGRDQEVQALARLVHAARHGPRVLQDEGRGRAHVRVGADAQVQARPDRGHQERDRRGVGMVQGDGRPGA